MNAEMEGNLSRLIGGLWVLHLRLREVMRTSVATWRLIVTFGRLPVYRPTGRNCPSLSPISQRRLPSCSSFEAVAVPESVLPRRCALYALSPETQTVRGFLCGEIDQAVEYAGKSLDESYALITTNLIWPLRRCPPVAGLAGVEEEAEPPSDAAIGSHVLLAVRQQHDLAEYSAFA